jgi:hypothetical protein
MVKMRRSTRQIRFRGKADVAAKYVYFADLRGGIAGTVLRSARLSGRNRNGAGYLSGFTFSSGSVDLQA